MPRDVTCWKLQTKIEFTFVVSIYLNLNRCLVLIDGRWRVVRRCSCQRVFKVTRWRREGGAEKIVLPHSCLATARRCAHLSNSAEHEWLQMRCCVFVAEHLQRSVLWRSRIRQTFCWTRHNFWPGFGLPCGKSRQSVTDWVSKFAKFYQCLKVRLDHFVDLKRCCKMGMCRYTRKRAKVARVFLFWAKPRFPTRPAKP